jgi:hypothetical protein
MTDPTRNWIVPPELLQAVAGDEPPSTGQAPWAVKAVSSPEGGYTSRLLVERWLEGRGVPYRRKNEPDGKGRTVYVLKQCPFDPAHADPDACIMQAPDGRMSAHCFHNGCTGHGWQDFKLEIGPPSADHYDPPLQRTARPSRQTKRKVSQSPADTVPDACPSTSVAQSVLATTSAPKTVSIDPQNLMVGETMRQVTAVLLAAGDCYRRAGQLVRVTGHEIMPILSASELAGCLNQHAEVVISSEERNEYKPLPTAYANTWLNHPGEAARLRAITLFTLNPVYTLDWRLTAAGYDADTGIYYAGEAIEPREGTEHLDRLLRDFCFKTPGDRANYLGMLLTTVLVPRFIGSKPAVVFNGNQPGLGKSILAQIIAILRDGRVTETASFNPNDEEFEKRLGAIVRRGATTIIIDNAKAGGPRQPRIESACLERSITDPIVSFRLLGYSKEIRAENSHIFCITANSAQLGPDLVSRSVMVALHHDGNPKRRAFSMRDPEGFALEHRAALLGELLGLVERWKAAGSPLSCAPTRFNKKGWGEIVGGVLQTAGIPDFLANADTAAEEMDESRRDFAALIAVIADLPRMERTAGDLATIALSNGLLQSALGDGSQRGHATRMGILASRFIGDPFPLPDDQFAILRRIDGRDGSVYSVEVQLS